MISIAKLFGRGVLGLALLAGLSLPFTKAAEPARLATVDEYKAKAFEALRAGRFEQTTEFLGQAAKLSQDPVLGKMAGWTQEFQVQRDAFRAERRKEYDKAVGDVKLLLANGKESYAIDAASRAYALAEDKSGFHKENWVKDLIGKSARYAEQCDAEQQWLKAMRIYSDLSAVEPSEPKWKEHLKVATRRVRLLAVYTPEVLRKIQESELKDREEVEALLKPTTKPVVANGNKPTTRPQADEAFKSDWRDMFKGVSIDMLRDALAYANDQYYRDVTYKQLTGGGLKGLKVVATTPGLEKAFPKLADKQLQQQFVDYLDKTITALQGIRIEQSEGFLRMVLGEKDGDKPNDRLGDLRVMNLRTVALPEEVLINEFADGAFGELDPFTNVIWPTEVEEFKKTTKGEFSGVGIQIQSDDDGSLKVVSPLEGSPAYQAGIKAGDIITHINGKLAKGITITQAVKQITGPPKTTVRLTVKSIDGTSKEHQLVRDTIKVQSIKGWLHKPGGGWDYMIDQDQKIGYIRLTNFTQTTSDDLDKAIAELGSGLKGVILDLRGNPGGLLSSAADISDKFITGDKVLVSTKPDRPTGNREQFLRSKPNGDNIDLPLVVLVNQYSASASEIVAGALKDHRRALKIVGERTFGKGSVQMLFRLDNRESYLKLTTSHYYLPSGRCLHREENSTDWGVDPDVKIEITPEQMKAYLEARQEADVLRGDGAAATKPVDLKKDVLGRDAQLSAALLLMRLHLSGAQL